ncbi:DUF2087 domain-containing protein [Rhodovulum kholense]|uniref:DUF2087 domain-containing protein n=1 Tax=Rhodovulum kholense TaxID=453584 RepID=A0A8E2VLK5_9RHOB|nr:DUF2087 domain-containing protein [Rhodovulum kholense]PTW50672.1 hypothetical protein C8N38_104308 [Rhodovulum kholense]
MTRPSIPLAIEDISAFSRALAHQLRAAEAAPSHLSLMNMLARAGGFRNFQHLRADRLAEDRLTDAAPAPVPDPAPVDHRRIERTLTHFDENGRLVRWPSRRAMQVLCLWALWARLPAGQTWTERQVNERLNAWHLFGDAALLRRDLFETGLVTRQRDGSDYRRIEQAPPPEPRALIRLLAQRG